MARVSSPTFLKYDFSSLCILNKTQCIFYVRARTLKTACSFFTYPVFLTPEICHGVVSYIATLCHSPPKMIVQGHEAKLLAFLTVVLHTIPRNIQKHFPPLNSFVFRTHFSRHCANNLY